MTTGYWLAIVGRILLLCLVTMVLFFVGLLLMGFLAVLAGILFSGSGTVGLIVLGILGIAAYSFLIAVMSGIAMRFSYSLYTELKLRQPVESVSNWWAGKSLLVFTAIGCVLLALIALTSPAEQVREAREVIQLK